MKEIKYFKKTYWNKRIIHRYLGYALCIPLFITATTGFLYKILRDVFGFEKDSIGFLMKIHQMSFLFNNSSVVYTALMGILVTSLVVFGYSMIYNPLLFGTSRSSSFRKLPQSIREYHHRYSSVIFILLLFMALTGSIYRFSRNALGFEKSTVGWILSLHQMYYLPNWLSVIWITFVYISITSLILTGTRLLPIVNNYFQSSNSYQILTSSQNQSNSTNSVNNSTISNNDNIDINHNNNNNSTNNISHAIINDSPLSTSLNDQTITINNVNNNNLNTSNGDDYEITYSLDQQNQHLLSSSSTSFSSPPNNRNKTSVETID